MDNGLCNICKFLYVFIVFVFTTKLILSTRHEFFLKQSIWETVFTKQMTDQEDNINQDKIVLDKNNQEK